MGPPCAPAPAPVQQPGRPTANRTGTSALPAASLQTESRRLCTRTHLGQQRTDFEVGLLVPCGGHLCHGDFRPRRLLQSRLMDCA